LEALRWVKAPDDGIFDFDLFYIFSNNILLTKAMILVPYDFTPPCDCAIQHATIIARQGNHPIQLLHVVNSDSKTLMRRDKITLKDLNERMASLAARVQRESGIETGYEMVTGSIFTTIPEYAVDSKAKLVIIGTSGLIGLQHLFGSNVIKIAEKSVVPDIIVQERPLRPHGYKIIVMPMDAGKESKQKTFQTTALAKIFNGIVHIFAAHETDEFLKNAVDNNIHFASRHLAAQGIPNEIAYETEGGKRYVDQIIQYAIKVEADLLTIMTGDHRGLLDIISASVTEGEHIVNNKAQIPVMCIDPQNALYGSVFTY
jgi:nucleotide-binding universal stress UspA family protein